MFEYFPGNYVWNMTVNHAIVSGARIGEIDQMCRPLLDASKADGNDASATEAFLASWRVVADRLVEQAKADEKAGHLISAGEKLGRASIYYLTAERMQRPGAQGREDLYRKVVDTFRRSIEFGRENCEFVEVPYSADGRDTTFPALFIRGEGDGPRPCVVEFNGLDSTKEMVYGNGLAQKFAKRGISTLIMDHPGSGEALRLRGMTGSHQSEKFATAGLGYLASRDDCDAGRCGVAGWSLGGYYAPRAAAFEPRFKACVSWGAIYSWAELGAYREERGTQPSVPHFAEHIAWVFGLKNLEELPPFAAKMSMAEHSHRITMPYLVIHGSNDRQIPALFAQKQFDAAVNSSRRELHIVTPEEGGVEHVGFDNPTFTTSYIADWLAETLA
ncbi:prolyl oligopeptidase family serine peptidase [Actinomadura graeca]|uniref:Prolyl oligopeptidase family serine peptidase n=1 Tax=Actinomadura graeca TaxID=2750812 RepID=A0ABX8QZW0_9ACTN|nr:prolyl oligopeptidase family serine peptidase [Actinomadura graeca]QXJ24272.1 prolyl oligopeptidase family serine peptidase [Actinomadura graeca]